MIKTLTKKSENMGNKTYAAKLTRVNIVRTILIHKLLFILWIWC